MAPSNSQSWIVFSDCLHKKRCGSAATERSLVSLRFEKNIIFTEKHIYRDGNTTSKA